MTKCECFVDTYIAKLWLGAAATAITGIFSFCLCPYNISTRCNWKLKSLCWGPIQITSKTGACKGCDAILQWCLHWSVLRCGQPLWEQTWVQLLRLEADCLTGILDWHSISPSIGIETQNAAARARKLRTRLKTCDDNDIVDGAAGSLNMVLLGNRIRRRRNNSVWAALPWNLCLKDTPERRLKNRSPRIQWLWCWLRQHFAKLVGELNHSNIFCALFLLLLLGPVPAATRAPGTRNCCIGRSRSSYLRQRWSNGDRCSCRRLVLAITNHCNEFQEPQDICQFHVCGIYLQAWTLQDICERYLQDSV